MKTIDLPDIAVIVGVILIAVAIYMALGVVAFIAFMGTVLIVIGALAAWKRAQRPAR
ncbi:MAG: hypothetical protein IPM06_19750 [Rhizobiales bacterium]|nr:hypothetical protein [Hyphomicrobiales bacterium]